MKISVEIKDTRTDDNEPCSVEIFCDMAALNRLIDDLKSLKEAGDHFHYMTEEWGEGELSAKKVFEKNHLGHHLKLTLMPGKTE